MSWCKLERSGLSDALSVSVLQTMMQCHGRQSYTRLGVWYVQDVSLHLQALLVDTLILLGYGHTNGSTRFGCTVYIITAQPEVWLNALYLSGFLYEDGITCFFFV